MSLEDIKKELERKLSDAMFDLKNSNWKNVSDFQRTYGFCLGLNVALNQVNIAMGKHAYDYKNAKILSKMNFDGLPLMKLKEIKDYSFPFLE